MPVMNRRPTADALKALPLFAVLLACGIDLEGPQPPGYERISRDEVIAACEQHPECVPDERWNHDLLVSSAE